MRRPVVRISTVTMAEAFLTAETGVVRLEDVSLQYGSGPEVLRDVSLSLETGSFHFLTGPSGAGKTSLLRLLHLALRPTRGTVRLFDRDVSRLGRKHRPALRRRIGVVSQEFGLISHLTAAENVALPLRIAKANAGEIRENVTELLRWVGLGRELDELPEALSEGQKQRVAVARAVIARPDLLLADEPTGNVDENAAMRLIHLMEELNKVGTAVVFATHDESLVSRFGHPTHVLDGGELVRADPVEGMIGEHAEA